jgi:hypothetical protein
MIRLYVINNFGQSPYPLVGLAAALKGVLYFNSRCIRLQPHTCPCTQAHAARLQSIRGHAAPGHRGCRASQSSRPFLLIVVTYILHTYTSGNS